MSEGSFDELVRALRANGNEVTVCEVELEELTDDLAAVVTRTEDGEVLHASLVEGERAESMRRIFVSAADFDGPLHDAE